VEEHFKSCPACGDAITDFLREYSQKPIGGNYQLVARLGRGGMGEVYRARHIFLQSDCVIKVMRPNVAEDPQLGERFIREARVARKIQHRNVASLYEFSGLPDGSYYMASEFIDGKNVGQLIRQHGALAPEYVTRLSIQALNGLQAIHEAGFVHRDISPDNIMVTTDDRGADLVKIIDLGIAKQDAEAGEEMTKTGMFIGKLKYASPEHLGTLGEGQRIDGRADIYSFGLVMYEMLAGKAAFQANTPHQYMVMQTRETPEPLKIDRAIAGSAELEALLMRAVAKDRNLRFASAAEFAGALSRLSSGGGELRSASTDVTAPQTLPTAMTPLPLAMPAASARVIGDTTDPYSLLPPPPSQGRSRKPIIAVAVVFILLVAVIAGALGLGLFRRLSASPPGPVAVAPVAQPPAIVASPTPAPSLATAAPEPAAITVDAEPADAAPTESESTSSSPVAEPVSSEASARQESTPARHVEKTRAAVKKSSDRKDDEKADAKPVDDDDMQTVEKAIETEQSIRDKVTSRFKKNRGWIFGRKP